MLTLEIRCDLTNLSVIMCFSRGKKLSTFILKTPQDKKLV